MAAGSRRPPLEYAAVLVGANILADSQAENVDVQLRDVVLEATSRIPSFSGYRRYMLDSGLVFDCYRDSWRGLDFACLAHEGVRMEFVRAFLEAFRNLMDKNHSTVEVEAAGPFGLQGTFGDEICELLATYNRPDADRVQAIQEKVDALRGDLVEAMDRLLLRGDVIQTLQDRSQLLNDTAVQFRTQAHAVRRRIRWRRLACPIAAVVIGLLLITVGLWTACGLTFEHC
mmetsp:Transcript_30608/g.66019  ORF Transcript_30608/g.66019 Transcript_30608/m.66019 type:complete len:229 (+) Transcript_30608:141-827(+)